MRCFTLHVSQPDWMLHPMQEFIREGDVAEVLGCAASTASNLLCKAASAVMGRIAERPVPG